MPNYRAIIWHNDKNQTVEHCSIFGNKSYAVRCARERARSGEDYAVENTAGQIVYGIVTKR